jgi:hypothetical protein
VANSPSSVDLTRLVSTLSRAGVSAVLAACAARLLETGEDPPAPASAPELLDAPAMAKRLGVNESWSGPSIALAVYPASGSADTSDSIRLL